MAPTVGRASMAGSKVPRIRAHPDALVAQPLGCGPHALRLDLLPAEGLHYDGPVEALVRHRRHLADARCTQPTAPRTMRV